MLKAGINVGIGTDGAASNNDLDMFEEMRLAALVAKNASNDPTVLPAAQAVAMATRLGARALHMEQLIGSLEPGKRADLILVDLARAHNAPRFRREPEGDLRPVGLRRPCPRRDRRDGERPLGHARRAVDHPRRGRPARPGRGLRPPHRSVPDRARALGALQADRHRRRAGGGELRGAGEGPAGRSGRRAGGAVLARHRNPVRAPLPRVRHLLLVGRPRPGPVALSRGRIPGRRRRR